MSSVVSPRQVGDSIRPILIFPSNANGNFATTVAQNFLAGAFDRLGGDASAPYESCDFVLFTGTHVGSAGTQTDVATLQHSTLVGSAYANYTDPTLGTLAQCTLTADQTITRYKVNLIGANQFLQTTITCTFATMTSPTVGAILVLGGSSITPTVFP